jgi:hypothetical protein
MAHPDGGPGTALVPTGARRPAAGSLAALARPVGALAGLVLADVLRNPRARAAALDLAGSLLGRLAGARPAGRPPRPAQASGGVLVRRVDTAIIVVRRPVPPAR